jgi:SAM-dependent methyltransferase
LNRDFIARHWYAYVYEQQENQRDDAEFLLHILRAQPGDALFHILEVACGGGRLTVPFAKAGYAVTGFDADEHMLLRCYARARGLENLRLFMADAVRDDWGSDYDGVVVGGNFLINIESDKDYVEAQEAVIRNAASALRPGGCLLMDFDMHYDPAAYFNRLGESSYFQGTDDLGTYGRTVSYGSVYDSTTRMCAGADHWELTTNGGEHFVISKLWHKHIPTREQVWSWCAQAGFTIQQTYKNHSQEPVPKPLDETTHRITLLAKKE